MILQKLSHSIKRRDWGAAVIEVGIVVLGIFIGLQVDDWNEARKNRALEQEYLERLLADMNGSIEDYLDNVGWDRERLITQNVVLESLRSGVLPEDHRGEFQSGLGGLGRVNPQRRRWGTAEELVSTGRIALIQNIGLRTEIAAADAWYARNDKIVQYSLDRLNHLMPHLTRHFQIISFGDNDGTAVIEFEFDELRNSPEFLNHMAEAHQSTNAIYIFSFNSMLRIQGLRDQIASQLNRDTASMPALPTRDEFDWRRQAAAQGK